MRSRARPGSRATGVWGPAETVPRSPAWLAERLSTLVCLDEDDEDPGSSHACTGNSRSPTPYHPCMRQRRHRMRKRQRRDSAREWINSGAKVTVKAYAKRYGVDMYTAYEDLTLSALPFSHPAERCAQRPPPNSRRVAEHLTDDVDDHWWIMLDGRLFFVAGYTSGGD